METLCPCPFLSAVLWLRTRHRPPGRGGGSWGMGPFPDNQASCQTLLSGL